VVAYNCSAKPGSTSRVEGLQAGTGARLWQWAVPKGWELDKRAPVVLSSGATATASEVVAALLLPGPSPDRLERPGPTGAAPARATVLVDHHDYQAGDLVVLDAASGEPLWELDGLVGWVIPEVRVPAKDRRRQALASGEREVVEAH
jgi:outer membrane protein assembly factor BamB